MMADKTRKAGNSRRVASETICEGPSHQDLLKMYLDLPKKERSNLFADTARAAELTDLSQRTIQFWIETGSIRAVPIGKKYQVYLESLRAYLEKQAKKAAG